MKLNSLLQFFVPKNKNYFPLFYDIALVSLKMTELMKRISETTDNEMRLNLVSELVQLNNNCHSKAKVIIEEMKKSFIAPFDKEDILYLSKQLIHFTDDIQGSANRLLLPDINKINEPVVELINCIYNAAQELTQIFSKIHDYSEYSSIKILCRNICEIEYKADKIFNSAMSSFFDNQKDALTAYKYKEVLESLEVTTDKSKAVALTIESVVLKYI